MAHPPGNRHRPTARTRSIVKEAAMHGVAEQAICAILGASIRRQSPITRDVLRRHYAEELRQSRAKGLWRVAATAYARATGDDGKPADPSMTRWWLERRDPEMWREAPHRVEIGRPNDFAHMSDAELADEIMRLEQLVDVPAIKAGLPAPPENDSGDAAPCVAGMPADRFQDT